MTWREAYDALKAALTAAPVVVAHSLPIIDGVQANTSIDKLAEKFQTGFTDNAYTLVIEHPGASTLTQTDRRMYLRDAFSVIIAENPKLREAQSLDPLVIPYDIARAVIGRPGGAGGNNFIGAEEFYRYAGDAQGFLFHRFTFVTTTSLPVAGSPPSRPSPAQL